MNLNELKAQVALGEESRRQFKHDATRQPDSGENPHGELQHSQSDPGVVHRQGAAALPGPRFGYQTRAGRLAGD
jgi:hypothetical protein